MGGDLRTLAWSVETVLVRLGEEVLAGCWVLALVGTGAFLLLLENLVVLGGGLVGGFFDPLVVALCNDDAFGRVIVGLGWQALGLGGHSRTLVGDQLD